MGIWEGFSYSSPPTAALAAIQQAVKGVAAGGLSWGTRSGRKSHGGGGKLPKAKLVQGLCH